MKRFLGAVLAVSLVCVSSGVSRADEKDATAILDKAIKALGGEEKLSKDQGVFGEGQRERSRSAATTTNSRSRRPTRASITTGRSSKASSVTMTSRATTVLNGDKGWRKFGDMDYGHGRRPGHQREANDLSRRSSPA